MKKPGTQHSLSRTEEVSSSKYMALMSCLASLIVLFTSGSPLAQISFQRTYGGIRYDEGYSVEQTMDGGYVVAGYTRSFGAGLSDVYLVKTDSLGEVVWARTYGGSEEDEGYSVQQTLDGGYIIAGKTSSFGAGSTDVYLVKTDSLGDTSWTRTYGGSRTEVGYSVQQTLDGGYIIAGRTSSFGPGGVFLVKTDSLGGAAWTRTYGGVRSEGYSVEQTPDGGYVVAGYIWEVAADSHDVYLVKTDSVGNTVWTKKYGGNRTDEGHSVQRAPGGGYIVVGWTYASDSDSYDVWLLRTTPLGDTVWTRAYGGSKWELGYSVQYTLDGGYVITGYTESFSTGSYGAYLVKTDSLGDTVWTRTYGGTDGDLARCVRQTQDGGYVAVGHTGSFGAGLLDVYLVKTEGTGAVGLEEWAAESHGDESGFRFFQNHPNPFVSSTVITYLLPVSGFVVLEIHDVTGQLVQTLVQEPQQHGFYQIPWDAQNRAAGIYFCTLQTGKLRGTRKMVLVK